MLGSRSKIKCLVIAYNCAKLYAVVLFAVVLLFLLSLLIYHCFVVFVVIVDLSCHVVHVRDVQVFI